MKLGDDAEAAVVHDQNLDRDVQLPDQRQFLNIHLKRAVPIDAQNQSVGLEPAYSKCNRQGVSHRSMSRGGV